MHCGGLKDYERLTAKQYKFWMDAMYLDTNFLSKIAGRSESERLLKIIEAIVDSSHDGIWVCDGQGKIVAHNEASLNFIGVTSEMVLGKNIRQIDKEPFIAGSVSLEALEKQRLITRYNRMPLTNKLLLVTAKPVFDKSGQLELIIVNDRDMTDLVEKQTELKKSKENVERLQDEIRLMASFDQSLNDLICQSPKFFDTVRTALMLASLDESNILLLGESGVGKGMVAHLIHQGSQRASRNFVHVNCAALPEALLEAELFGYERGAFTGASQKGKVGFIEIADKGTLFLDEIGALPFSLQSKILTYLDTRILNRLGGTRPINTDCKIIAATNSDLNEMVTTNQFRSDLFYRLNTFSIKIPPLRERIEDLFALAIYFTKKYNEKYQKACKLGPCGFSRLCKYHFPGNIRELDNMIKRAIAMTDGNLIDDAIATYINNESEVCPDVETTVYDEQHIDLRKITSSFEAMIIETSMKGVRNTRQLAKKLNVSQATIIRKMNQAGIKFKQQTKAT